jgi:hypothetical protein
MDNTGKKKNWERAISLISRMIEDRVEIYEVMRIFTPMASASRKRLLLCDIDITSVDLDEVELAIDRYKRTLNDLSETRIEQRVRRSMFFKTLSEHYDKNKV